MSTPSLIHIIEGALLAYGQALSLEQLKKLFPEEDAPSNDALREALVSLASCYQERALELQEVASGWRFQVRQGLSPWINKLWEEKPPRYSRALLETLALIAYRQPITRAEIEEVRGVAVSSHIIKTLLERDWIRVVGQRDVPGKPNLLGTTKTFLDYFNLRNLAELPALSELSDLQEVEEQLARQLSLPTEEHPSDLSEELLDECESA